MSLYALFITTNELNAKFLNKLALKLRDYEYTWPDQPDHFALLTNSELSTLNISQPLPPLTPPVTAPSSNDFVGWDPKRIAHWYQENAEELKKLGIDEILAFCLIDEQGVKDESGLIVSIPYDEDLREKGVVRRLRLPWTQVDICMANISVANLFIEEMTVDEDDMLEDREYEYAIPPPHPDPKVEELYKKTAEEVRKKRQEDEEALRKEEAL